MGKKSKAKFVYFKPNLYSEKFENLLTSGKYSDFTVKVGNETLKLHKNILASSSDYFKDNVNDSELTVDKNDIKNDFHHLNLFLNQNQKRILIKNHQDLCHN